MNRITSTKKKAQPKPLLAYFAISDGSRPLAVDLGIAMPQRGSAFDFLAQVNDLYDDAGSNERRIVFTDGASNSASLNRKDWPLLADLLNKESFARISKNLDRIFTVGRHAGTFQDRVEHWATETLGAESLNDTKERNLRFLEKALDLVHACGLSRENAHGLVNYAYERPAGDVWISQEVGGVMATLAALCTAQGTSLSNASNDELVRIWLEADTIKSQQDRTRREFITYATSCLGGANG